MTYGAQLIKKSFYFARLFIFDLNSFPDEFIVRYQLVQLILFDCDPYRAFHSSAVIP